MRTLSPFDSPWPWEEALPCSLTIESGFEHLRLDSLPPPELLVQLLNLQFPIPDDSLPHFDHHVLDLHPIRKDSPTTLQLQSLQRTLLQS